MDVSFDGGRYEVPDLPTIRPVKIEDILRQHRTRIVLHTTQGTVVLKHISKRMKEHIDVIRRIRYPDAWRLEQEARIAYPLALAEGADQSAIDNAMRIAEDLKPTEDCYLLGCIEYPFLTTMDDLDAFIQSLTDEEQEALRQLHTHLVAWNTPVDYSALEIAERFHASIIPIEAITEPTYQQFVALHNVIEQERRQTEALYKKMEVL